MPYDKISLCFGPSTWCTYTLRMFYNGFSWVFRCFCMCLRRMFQIFHLLQMYVANIAWGCFKNRSGVAHVSLTPVASGQRAVVRLRLLPHAAHLTLFSPSPSFPSLHLASALALECESSSLLRSDAGDGVGWDAGCRVRGIGCDADIGAGAASGRVLQPDIRALAPK